MRFKKKERKKKERVNNINKCFKKKKKIFNATKFHHRKGMTNCPEYILLTSSYGMHTHTIV
jgi:hypothetical protein